MSGRKSFDDPGLLSRMLQSRDNVAMLQLDVCSCFGRGFHLTAPGYILESVKFRARQGENACGIGFSKMILEFAVALFLIHGFSMLSRLLARRREVSSYGSRSMRGTRGVRTDRQRRVAGVGEGVRSDGAGSMSRKAPGWHPYERASGQLFRPCKRPPLGLRPRPELP
jgi:hypothetical protein